MPPKGVDAQAREAMTHEIAWCLTAMQAGQNMIDAARQIEAKCYDSAKDAQDYERKVEKRLAKAAKALEAMATPHIYGAAPPGFKCCFCGGDSSIRGFCPLSPVYNPGYLVSFAPDLVAHEMCALYSSGAQVDMDLLGDNPRIRVVMENPDVVDVESLRSARRRGKGLTCALCGLKGATVGCYSCSRRSFHFPCALRAGLVEWHRWRTGHRQRVVHCTEHLDPRCLVSWPDSDYEDDERLIEGRVTDGPHEGQYLVLYDSDQESMKPCELAANARMCRPPPGAARWAAFADLCRRSGVPDAAAASHSLQASRLLDSDVCCNVRVRLGGMPLDQAARVAARRPKADADAACARPLAVTEGERAESRAVVASVLGPAPRARGAKITVPTPARRSLEPLPWRAGAPVLDLAAAWLQCRDIDALATTGRLGYSTVKTDANRLFTAMLARDHGADGAAALRAGYYTDAWQACRALEGARLRWAARHAPTENAGPRATSFRATRPRHDRRAAVQKVGSPGAHGDVTICAADLLEGPLCAFVVEVSTIAVGVGIAIGERGRNPSPFWLGCEPCDGSAGISFGLDLHEGLFYGTNVEPRPLGSFLPRRALDEDSLDEKLSHSPLRIGVVVDRRFPRQRLSFYVDGEFVGVGLESITDGVALDHVRPAVSLREGGDSATLRPAFPVVDPVADATYGAPPHRLRTDTSDDGAELTEAEVRGALQAAGGRMKTKDLLVRFKARLKANPANKDAIKRILRAVADVDSDSGVRMLVLKAE